MQKYQIELSTGSCIFTSKEEAQKLIDFMNSNPSGKYLYHALIDLKGKKHIIQVPFVIHILEISDDDYFSMTDKTI